MLARWGAILIGVLASGCSILTTSDSQFVGTSDVGRIILVSPYESGWCYTRYDQGMAHDEVCEVGSTVRYTADLESADTRLPEEIPFYVLGLFDYMAQEMAYSP